MTVKTVPMVTHKINKLCGIFNGLSSLFWLTARALRSSFERETNQRCLIPSVKAIRVRVRSLDSLGCTRPGSLFAATAPLRHRIPLWVPPPDVNFSRALSFLSLPHVIGTGTSPLSPGFPPKHVEQNRRAPLVSWRTLVHPRFAEIGPGHSLGRSRGFINT
jgi:hypothetical protein